MQIGTRQWTINAADLPTGVFYKPNIRVKEIEFSGYAADTDTFEILDRDGTLVWSGNGKADLSPVRSGDVGWVNGMEISDLTAGTIFVFIA